MSDNSMKDIKTQKLMNRIIIQVITKKERISYL